VVRRQARDVGSGASARGQRAAGHPDAELRHVLLCAGSLPYQRGALGDATLSIAMALQGSGETGAIVGAAAMFTDDPSGAPTWIQVHVHGHIGWPPGASYRIVALTPLDAVRTT
jgi:hypothetical protein